MLAMIFIVAIPKAFATNKESNTLIIYSASQSEPALVKQMEAMISPYTNSKTIAYNQLTKSDLKDFQAMIYIGLKKENIKELVDQDLKETKILMIGENIEQFNGFESVKKGVQQQIASIDDVPFEKSFQLQQIKNIKANAIISEKRQMQGRTILWGNDRQYYLPVKEIPQQLQWAIQPKITAFFGWKMNEKQKAAIVIDQITPNTSVDKLTKITNVLKAEKVPVILAIQPLGQGDRENILTTFDENKKLRKKIIELQKEGATVLISGLKPTIDKSTLVQSEFWQNDVDQPMKEAVESASLSSINRNDFPSEELFNEKRHEIGQKEQQLTNEAWNEAIDETVKVGIIPTGFTIENDGASKYVYKALAEKTTSYFGNIQFGDSKVDRVLQSTIIQSDLLNKTTIYPINIQANNSIDEQLFQLQKINGAFAGVKIHVDDSIQVLHSTIQKIEEIPSFHWLTPIEINGQLHSDLVNISTASNGEIIVEKPNKILYQLKMIYKNNLFEFILWILFGLVLLFVLLFFFNVIRLRMSLKKRLFEERKPNG